MKILAATFLVMISFSAQAYVRPTGSFVPTECGAQSYQTFTEVNAESPEIPAARIGEVCAGYIVGDNRPDMENMAFQFRGDGVAETYKVVNVSSPLMFLESGHTKKLFHMVDNRGERTTLKMTLDKDHNFVRAAGAIGTQGYYVSGFQKVFVAK